MANYNNLKATINANIKANGNEEITGPILNTVLNQAVTTLGAGYQYMGVATPATSPGTPDANVFYIAATPGTYTNFGGKVVADGEVAILKYNGSWAKEVTGAATAAQVTQLGQKLIKLTGFGTDGQLGGITGVGQVYYNTNSKLLRKCVTFPDVLHATYETVPYYDGAIYTYNEDFYIWNGSELVSKTKEISAVLDDGQFTDGYYINSVGNLVANEDWGVTDYVPIEQLQTIEWKFADASVGTNSPCIIFYNANKSRVDYATSYGNGVRTFNPGGYSSQTKYVRASFLKSASSAWVKLNGLYVWNRDGLSAQIARGLSVLESRISDDEKRLIKLVGFGTNSQTAGVTGVGDVYYNTSTKLLRRCVTYDTVYETIPYYDGAIYTYNEHLYVWNGTDLVSDDIHITDIKRSVIRVGWDVLTSNSIVRGGISTQCSYIFHVKKGDAVKVTANQHNDTSLLAFSETMPEVGSAVTIISNGYSQTVPRTVTYSCASDGYVMVTVIRSYESDIQFDLQTWDVATYTDVLSVEPIEAQDVNFIPNIIFENISADAAGEMSSWTGEQIINGIYEQLRTAHPEYIKRRSLGKDASGLYDIWLYEFNNTVDEWFAISNSTSVYGDNLVNSTGLESNQFRVTKEWFDTFFADKEYKNIYVESVFNVRKPILCLSYESETVGGIEYYKFTCDGTVKEVVSEEQHGVTLYWTTEVKTYDQHCLFISGVHGNEPAGYLGTALALKYLVEHHSGNPSLDYIFNHVKLSVIPILNIWGANQTPKIRANANDVNLNRYTSTLATEQQVLFDYVNSIKGELSCFIDFHTSELWNNYGFVYAIGTKQSKLFPALTTTANHLCKHWFPTMPPYNWNVGTTPTMVGSNYIKSHCDVESATVEFCGQDLMAFGNCSRWDAKYMSYVLENYVNYIISVCNIRLKSNSKNIVDSSFYDHDVML